MIVLQDFGVGAALALVVSFIACRALVRGGPVDLPTEPRKHHGVPTPTSGGLGAGVGFAAGLIALALFSNGWRHAVTEEGAATITVAVAFAYGFLALGFIDDAHPLGPRLKFAVFSGLSIGAALSVGIVTALPLGGGVALKLGFWFALFGTGLWLFTLINSVNFMDGVNGLAMGCVAIGLCSLAAIGYAKGGTISPVIALCGAGALVGFLLWNFPGGRLFAGDSGALFAGALAAIVALIIIRRTGLSPFIPPIVFFPLLADVLLTLAYRAGRGRSLLDGHSEHLYQIARRAGWSHVRVTLCYWAAMALCGTIAYVAAIQRDSPAPWIALAGLAVVSLILSYFVRKEAARRGIAEN